MEAVLTARPRPVPDALGFFRALRAAPDLAGVTASSSIAIRGGAMADRVGYAFLSGYHAALLALVESLDADRVTALAVTEAGGNHPRAIETTYVDGRLDGEKVFITMGTSAETLLVLAHEAIEDPDGRRRFRLCRVRSDAPGVALSAAPPTPFVPEIAHARARFDGAPVEEVLEGDGWADYVRPFRTVEDTHVHLAVVAWLLATGRRLGFPAAALEPGLAALVALRAVAGGDPRDPLLHLALEGAMQAASGFVEGLKDAWARAPREERERFERDRPLLSIAKKARQARVAKAWASVG